MFKKILALPTLLFVALLSCSSGDSGSDNTPDTTQLNVVINAEIVGTASQMPNGNGSGLVKFNISPNNATSYKVVFGDGETIETTTGIFTHTYSSSGTKTYEVEVTAFNGLKYFNSTKSIVVFVTTSEIWGDEFDADGAPNSSKWGYDLGAGGWGNNEPQYYTNRAENVIVQGGVLKIITKKESYLGSNYTSARLLTKGKFSFKYGKVEFRAKMPSGGGTWPALWMLGDNISTVGWPACGEIDIMEHLGNQLNKIYGTLHYPDHSGGSSDGSTTVISNATTEFHLYSVDWRADYIKFYVDNQLFKTFVNSASIPFNQNFFLIINCAIGGDFGGSIDPTFVSSIFEVDYVRVYN
ncbi:MULTISPECIES: family 16 glycosylhydrolase [unclassified Flavobacterium]|uniref:family 16 glycosylhydrolase n=1 Tax=unclassified Flavobacterium TaxID=196869 RepID=UPI0025BB7481|nr:MULTISPECIES: family 16 glycosylhydrolase [unclassified Flavobacterium]